MFCYARRTAVVGLAIYEFWFLAQILYWVDHNPATTNVMDARLDALRQKDPKATLEQRWMPYQRISNDLKRPSSSPKMPSSWTRRLRWEGIQRALEENQRRGKIVAGGSTITQQLRRICFFRANAALLRKARRRFSPRCSRRP